MSNYMDSMKKWSDELWKTFRAFQENPLSLDGFKLEEWERGLLRFQQKIEEGDLSDEAIYNMAQQLYESLVDGLKKLEQRVEVPKGPVPIGGHTLPPLDYPYDALQPYIDEETMRLHHQKHHQSYVDGLNKAERELQKARERRDFDLIKHWERELAFNGAGHYLHTLFWKIMGPEGGGSPKGDLLKEINRSFGSFDQFKTHFSQAAEKVEGVGWAILVWSPRSGRLEILQAEKHQNLTQWDDIPLLAIDVWEHAYYLQYKNDRKSYVENWWNVVNWPEVEKRFEQARQLQWEARL